MAQADPAFPLPPPLRWPLMLLPFALWGTAMAAMKPLLEGADPLLLASLRLLPAALVLLVVARLLGRSLRVDPGDIPALLAFSLVDASLFQGLLARGLFGEAINPVGWLGLLLGLLGIVCLGLPPELLRQWWLQGPAVEGLHPWSHGETWMLGAAAAMAVGTVLSRYATRRSDPVAVTAWHMLIGGAPLLLAAGLGPALAPGGSAAAALAALRPAWSTLDWGLMAFASLFGTALAYGLFFTFASRGDLTGFTALTFLTPVFALFCGFLLLEERLDPLQWLGAALALVSVLLINRRAQLWQPASAGPGLGAPVAPRPGEPGGQAREAEVG